MRKLMLGLATAALLGGCGTNSIKAQQPYSAARPSYCAVDRFEDFARLFVDDSAFQQNHTAAEIEKQSYDMAAEPEPKLVVRLVKREQMRFPIIPGVDERKRKSLEIDFEQPSADTARFKIFKPDTDYQVFYRFSRKKCWMLTRVEDDSL